MLGPTLGEVLGPDGGLGDAAGGAVNALIGPGVAAGIGVGRGGTGPAQAVSAPEAIERTTTTWPRRWLRIG